MTFEIPEALSDRQFTDSSRRDFLRAIAVAGVTAFCGTAHAAPGSRMKLSLSAYSFNRELPRNWYTRGREATPGKMTLFDFMDFAAEVGVDAVELTSYYFPKPLDSLMASEIKRYAFSHGLDISGTAIGNDFCLPDGPGSQTELDLAKEWLEHSNQLDAPMIRIFAGKVPKGFSKTATIERCAYNIQSLLPAAEQAGVVLALENHGGITAEPDDMLAIVERVGESPWFGVNFDSGNFALSDPYAALRKIAPHAVNAQIKVGIRRQPKGPKEPADLAQMIQILQEANYRGYVALEYEESEPPREAIPPLVKELRELIEQANAIVA